MAIETLELSAFTPLVRLESFAGAPEAHDMSASGVSRLIAWLEAGGQAFSADDARGPQFLEHD
jgi:hypothetical protein